MSDVFTVDGGTTEHSSWAGGGAAEGPSKDCGLGGRGQGPEDEKVRMTIKAANLQV